ncbi:hypothetical protein Tco_1367881 [Tanacetum coccineum]
MVFSIVLSLLAEYSPYVLKFIETCEEPTLIELYEVVCKAEDDLQINPSNKTNKRKSNDKENDEKKVRLVAVMIAVQHQALRKMNLKLHRWREEFVENKPEASSDFVI